LIGNSSKMVLNLMPRLVIAAKPLLGVERLVQSSHSGGNSQLTIPNPFAHRGIVSDRFRLDLESLEHKSHREFLLT
jgi:hypothetical protein